MNISVIGGGNVGTLIAGQFTSKGHKVTIYTRDVKKWSKDKITVFDCDLNKEYSYIPYRITSNVKEAVMNAALIIITLPSFAIKNFIVSAKDYIKKGTIVGIYPGTGANEFECGELIDKGCIIFGTQRICSVVRLKKYGKYVVTSGKRKKMYIGVIPIKYGEEIRSLFSELFDIETILLPNYLNVTLTPSNPILHPSRLYSLFKDYKAGIKYDRVPLFYEEWNDESSQILINCDKELHNVLNKISLDTSYIRPILEHYESTNYIEMTNKIRSISSFKGLKTPCIKESDRFIPDLQSRYFTADIPYGLIVIKSFAMIYSVNTPTIDLIISWYQQIVNKDYINLKSNTLVEDSIDLNLPQLYGLNNDEKIIKFYSR